MSAPADAERAAWRARHAAEAVALRARLAAALDALAELAEAEPAALAHRPPDGGWSALEVLEHVALANRSLLALAAKTAERSRRRLARGDAWPTRPPAPELVERAAREPRAWPHPPHMAPSGADAPAALARRLRTQRDEALALLDAMPEGEGTLHSIRMTRIPRGGRLDLYGWVDLAARHAERHRAQAERALRGPDRR